ncbi:hypothetical protein [Kribbella flavida]|nr:hypothetical protein [Kribbella flavida]
MTTRKHRREGLGVFAGFAMLPAAALTVPVGFIVDHLRPSPNLELAALVFAVLLLVGGVASAAFAIWVSVRGRRALRR